MPPIGGLAPGHIFRSFGRTITEADLVNFVNATGFTEVLFCDTEYLKTGSAIKGRVVPAVMVYASGEGLVVPFVQGTGKNWQEDSRYPQRGPVDLLQLGESDGCSSRSVLQATHLSVELAAETSRLGSTHCCEFPLLRSHPSYTSPRRFRELEKSPATSGNQQERPNPYISVISNCYRTRACSSDARPTLPRC